MRRERHVEIDLDPVAAANLLGRDQVRQRMHQVPLDGALQSAGRRTSCRCLRAADSPCAPSVSVKTNGVSAGGIEDPLLHHVQLDVENLAAVRSRPAA